MMAPSLETSCRGHLPITPATPLRAITTLIHRANKQAREITPSPERNNEDDLPYTPTCRVQQDLFEMPVRTALSSLHTSSMSYLITSSPIQSTSQPPSFTLVVISPQQPNHAQLLSASAETVRELELQEALREAIVKAEHQKANLIDMQSVMVLNGIYVDMPTTH
jgi:hypothetical protein